MMKRIFLVLCCLMTGTGFSCPLIFASLDDANQAYIASNIATGLFYKTSCARVIKPIKLPVSSESKDLMNAWNLNLNLDVLNLDVNDMENASLILVMNADEKVLLDRSYPKYKHKIQLITVCSGVDKVLSSESIDNFREDMFQLQDIISSRRWKCLDAKVL